MMEWISQLPDTVGGIRLAAILRAVLVLLSAALAIAVLRRRYAARAQTSHAVMLLQRGASYLIGSVALLWALRELGVKADILLGAAGVLTVAVGFASQTVASNVLSGLFLMGERPFMVGDVIDIGGTSGEVLSIDLLSIRLRTFDNLMVRIPSETVMKANVINRTHFDIRRIDLRMGIAYKEDLRRAQRVLLDVAESNPRCLAEPAPRFVHRGFGESSVDFQFSVWTTTAAFLDTQNELYIEIKEALDRERIEIPFPQRTLHVATQEAPSIVGGASGPART